MNATCKHVSSALSLRSRSHSRCVCRVVVIVVFTRPIPMFTGDLRPGRSVHYYPGGVGRVCRSGLPELLLELANGAFPRTRRHGLQVGTAGVQSGRRTTVDSQSPPMHRCKLAYNPKDMLVNYQVQSALRTQRHGHCLTNYYVTCKNVQCKQILPADDCTHPCGKLLLIRIYMHMNASWMPPCSINDNYCIHFYKFFFIGP